MAKKGLNILLIGCTQDLAAQVRTILREGALHFDYIQQIDLQDLQFFTFTSKDWDLILVDYSEPDFAALHAFKVLAGQGLKIPFIVLSSHGGEEKASQLMAKGAHDYVMQDNLARLIPAIQRSLREVANFQRVVDTQAALLKSEARFRAITSNLPGVVFQCLLTADNQVSFPYVNDGAITLLGLSPRLMMENPDLFHNLILAKDKSAYQDLMAASAKYLSSWNWEGCIQARGDKDIKWISLRATPRRTQEGLTLWDGIMLNISRNKLAEREIFRSREQLAELSSYLQKVKEQERAKIAREIHDDIGGTLTAIKCELQLCFDHTLRSPDFYLTRAQSVASLVDQVIDSTRRISLDLRPGILDCGIVAAIRWQVKEFVKRTNINCEVFCDQEDIPLDADLSIAIFRIFQETLTNISKHAEATKINVTLEEKDQAILLAIEDNGRGITQADIEKPDSFGIRGMRERCQQLKGSFHIAGGPGEGTSITICIPTRYLHDRGMIENDPDRAEADSSSSISVHER